MRLDVHPTCTYCNLCSLTLKGRCVQSLHEHSVVFEDMIDGQKAVTPYSGTFCCILRTLTVLFSWTMSTMKLAWCGENTGALPPSCGSLAVLQKRGHAVTKTHAAVIDNLPPSLLYSTILYYRSDVLKHLFIYTYMVIL